jgi:hypothetical protein
MIRITSIVALGAIAAVLAVPAVAGNGKGGGHTDPAGGGSGHVDPTSFAIAGQSPGSVTFSVTITSQGGGGTPSLEITNTCYDSMSVANYSATLAVTWASTTLGYGGPFASPSGEKCFAYVHVPGSTSPLVGGSFSYVAL